MSEAIAEPVVEAEPSEPAAEAAEPVVEQAAPEPASPEYVSYEEAQAIADQRLAAFLEQIESLTGETEQNNDEPVLDPFDPESVSKWYAQREERLLAQIDQRLQQIQAPFAAREEQETIQRGEARLQDVLADDIARNGDFATDPETGESPGKSLVRPLADMLFPQFEKRYGQTPRAADEAMSQAARIVRQLEAVAKKAAQNEQVNRLNTLAGVNGEPGSAGNGVVTLPETPLDNRSLALKYTAQARAAGS